MSEEHGEGEHNILIVDDVESHARATAESLEREGMNCTVVTSGEEALDELESSAYDIVITDLVMKPMSGLELMKSIRSRNGRIPIIILTGYPSTESALEAVHEEGVTYLRKPFEIENLRDVVNREVEGKNVTEDEPEESTSETGAQLQRHTEDLDLGEMVGKSEAMLRVFDTIRRVADTDVTCLIQGESGTGKEMVARAIHRNSRRSRERFVPLNCAALNEGVLESELFGHKKGAFTGAHRDRKGRFEFADGGTLFLDEIGDMPMETQTKFLRVLEQEEVSKLGENESTTVDVRILAATNQDLEKNVEEGEFREDLLYRLKVVEISLPPLRERAEDLPILMDHFREKFSEQHGKEVNDISPEAHKTLVSYHWPGNVRELKNCIESMVVTSRSDVLEVEDIPDYIKKEDEQPSDRIQLTGISIEEAERHLIENTLKMTDGNQKRAAEILEISPRTLSRRLKEYGLKDED